MDALVWAASAVLAGLLGNLAHDVLKHGGARSLVRMKRPSGAPRPIEEAWLYPREEGTFRFLTLDRSLTLAVEAETKI